MKTKTLRFRASWSSRIAGALVAACAALLGAACGDKKTDSGATQVAARVNKEVVTAEQINYLLQQQRGLRPEQSEFASKQALERLIDQELAVQKASELKLDREPRLLQHVEAARREFLSRAYFEKAGEAASKPTPEEVAEYYEATPALFKERRIYNLQEIAVEAKPEQTARLRTQLEAARNINEFLDYLKLNDFRFSTSQAVRAAEQLPLPSLGTFSAMKDGQAILNVTPNGAQVIFLAGSRLQPVTMEQATAAIEQFLLNERKRDILIKEIKALRDAAKIEYVGKYAGPGTVSASDAATSGSKGASSASIVDGPKQ
jgi:EpsD family peptidyl-prolyl cis-trans isomerase